ncbi:MAG: PAS domain S-box protein [Candidatus Micrarchaeota archaeon]
MASDADSGGMFRRIVESAREMIFVVRPDGRIEYANPYAVSLMKRRPGEISGKSIGELFAPEAAGGFQEILREVSTKGEASYREDKVHTPAGDIWLGSWLIPMGKGGKVAGFARDITAIKDAEASLEESRKRYLTMFEASPEGVVLLDRNGLILDANARLKEWLGYEPSEAIGKPLSEMPFLPPATRELLLSRLRERVKGRELEPADFEAVAKDGKHVWLRVSSNPVRDERGRTQGVLAVVANITDRKEAEMTLAESEERFRRMFEEGTVGISIVGLDGRFAKANNALCGMLGYSEAELRKIAFGELTHPDERERDIDAAKQMAEGKRQSYRVEKRYIRKSGETLWASLNASLMRGTDGKPKYFLSVIEDITERKAAEEALSESKETLRQLADASFEGIAITDNGKILAVNRTLEAMLGRGGSELAGRNAAEFIAPRSRKDAQRRLDEGGEEPFECACIRSDGSEIETEVRSKAIAYHGRKVDVIVMRDVTEAKAARKALAQSEERFRLIVERSRDIIMLTDPRGTIIYLSPACREILGYHPSDLVGKEMIMVHPDDAPMVRRAMMSAASGQSVSLEYRIAARDGTARWVSHSLGPIKDDGKVIMVVGVMRDITERRGAEEAMRESRDVYADLVENLNIGIFRWSAGVSGRFLQVNQGLADMFEAGSKDDLMRMPLVELHANHSDRRMVLDKLMREGCLKGEEVEFVTLGGRRFWGSLTAVKKVGRDGGPYFDGIIEDVTSRKLAERMMLEETGKAKELIDIADEMIIVIGADERVELVNRKGCGILGYPEAQVVGKNWFDSFIPERNREAMREVFRQLIDGKATAPEFYENPVLGKGGKEMNVRWHNTVLRGSGGRITATLSSGTLTGRPAEGRRAAAPGHQAY